MYQLQNPKKCQIDQDLPFININNLKSISFTKSNSSFYKNHYITQYKYKQKDMQVFNSSKMIYRNLGNTGLKVSIISLGNMINYKDQNRIVDQKLFRTCLQNGINFFDTAELYQSGKAEETLGQYLKNIQVDRQSIVVATKIWTARDPDINSTSSTNRKHIKQSITKCLKRLQMDYVDIVYAHRFDSQTPLQEICRGFHQIIQKNNAFYWATSNWDAQDIFNAFQICEKYNLHKPIAAQIQYNMLERKEVQIEYRMLLQKYKFGVVGWSALAGGFLTGKYMNGIPQQQINRFTDSIYFTTDVLKKFYLDPYQNQNTKNSLKKLHQLANRMGVKMNHLALAWVLKNKYISSGLIGARNSQQLLDNLKAIQLINNFTPQLQNQIQQILGTKPINPMNFLYGTQRPGLRQSLLS